MKAIKHTPTEQEYRDSFRHTPPEFVARAVNAHAQLVEALQRLLNLSFHPYVRQPDPEELPAWCSAQEQARAALAAAEAQP